MKYNKIIKNVLFILLAITIYIYINDNNIEKFSKKEVINDNKYQNKTAYEEDKKIIQKHTVRISEKELNKWIKAGFFLDDGNNDVSLLHNKCSPLCCRKQKYIPDELQPNANSDPELAKEILNGKYTHSNFRCIDQSIVRDYNGGASCLCIPIKKTNMYKKIEDGIIIKNGKYKLEWTELNSQSDWDKNECYIEVSLDKKGVSQIIFDDPSTYVYKYNKNKKIYVFKSLTLKITNLDGENYRVVDEKDTGGIIMTNDIMVESSNGDFVLSFKHEDKTSSKN
jgi:hypothetical protein